MEIVYRSCNGKIFYSEEECLEYEKTLDFKMYGPDGQTDRTEASFVVEFENSESAENFLETCRMMEICSDGIEPDCPGVYAWSDNNGKYFLLEPLTFKALKQYIKDTETQE